MLAHDGTCLLGLLDPFAHRVVILFHSVSVNTDMLNIFKYIFQKKI